MGHDEEMHENELNMVIWHVFVGLSSKSMKMMRLMLHSCLACVDF